MKYINTKTTTEEIDIEFPCYVRFSQVYYKIFNENYLLRLENWVRWSTGIEVKSTDTSNPFANDGWEFITEDQFNAVYDEVLEKIKTFNPELKEEAA